MRCVFFAVFLVAACTTVSAADSYTDAVSAVHRDDYDLAARLFRPLAEQGHAGAQSFLGVLYANGQGVPKDVIRAYLWLTVSIAGSRGNDGKTAIMN
jgi:TPR repeat protein